MPKHPHMKIQSELPIKQESSEVLPDCAIAHVSSRAAVGTIIF